MINGEKIKGIKFMTKKFVSDRPLENPSDDLLGFVDIAKNLAEVICKAPSDESLVFALNGSWGSGKTTCINFICHFIEHSSGGNKPIIIKFNPWWFSGKDELINIFFREFCFSIGKKEKLSKLREKIANYSEALSAAPIPKEISKSLSLISKLFWSNKKDLKKMYGEIRNFLIKNNNRFLVIIDDIDRLPAIEIKSIFRMIKAIADFPKTIYLLAFDKEVIESSLEDEKQRISGKDYLEKIIQIPIDLPNPNEICIRKLFIEHINSFFLDSDAVNIDQNYWREVYFNGIVHFLKNFRNLKQLINVLKITFPPLKGEVNIVDFIAIEAIRIFVPDLYKTIQNNSEMFIRYDMDRIFSKNSDSEVKTFLDTYFDRTNIKNKSLLLEFLKTIFPKVKGIYNNISYDSNSMSRWRRQLRICSPDIFPIYFKYRISDDLISNFEMQSIITSTGTKENFSQKLMHLSNQTTNKGITRLRVFLERFEDYTENEIPLENIPIVLSVFFNIGDQLLLTDDEDQGFFSLGNDIFIARIIFQLLRRFNTKEERFKIVRDAILDGSSLFTIVREITTMEQEHQESGSNKNIDKDWIIDPSHLIELKKIALRKIILSANTGELIKTSTKEMGYVIFRWFEWSDGTEVKEWISNLKNNDADLINFLVMFLTRIKRQSENEYVPKIIWILDPKTIESLVDPSQIIDGCVRIMNESPEWLVNKKKLALRTFIKDYYLRLEGKDPKDPLILDNE